MRVTTKGQVTIPKAVRESCGIRAGQEVRFVERNGQVVLEKAQGEDAWHRYRGFLRLRKRTDQVIRALRGERP